MSTPSDRRRPYQSTRRAEQAARTSADIVAAATRLLARDGWGNTTMTKVAAEAGVAVETVYQRFKSKADLLRAAVDATIGGGTSQPLQEQERFTRLGHGETAERLATLALLATDINARTHALFESWRQAAGADAAIAAELLEYETHRRSDAGAALALIRGGPVDERTVDAIWAVSSPDVYSKLVRDRAWSSADYADFVQKIVRALLAVDAPR
jgi:AcrR family transcriptional regulator